MQDGLDQLHLDCASCPYSTAPPYTNETLSAGNPRVNVFAPDESPPAGAGGGTPSVVSLAPVLGGAGVLTAVIYDANGNVVSGAPVSLTGVGALPLNGVTNALGKVVFLVSPLATGFARASTGGVSSNPVALGP
jgi:hypothetical protein